jgi:glyoxylase-like metal-dependent hydrolase (beta-lactamase superfamily II)
MTAWMSDLLRRLVGAALFLAVAHAHASEAEYPELSVEVPLRQISPHVWFVRGAAGVATDNEGFISNAGFIVTDGGVVVVDALGSPSLGWALRQAIRTVTDKPVTHLVLTHYHADHIYGAQVFDDEGAEVLAPLGAEDYLDSEVAQNRLEERRNSLFPWVDDSTRLVPPDRLLDRKTTLTLGDVTLTLLFLGSAHSEGDLALLVEPDRVLFSGDIIFAGRTPFVGDADTRQWLDSLERMESMRIEALIPGHGPAATDPNEAVGMTRRYIAHLRAAMGAAVEELVSFDEAYQAADWSEFNQLPAFESANRRNAYQVYLSIEAEQLGE